MTKKIKKSYRADFKLEAIKYAELTSNIEAAR
jgi:hypothetical protein